MKIESLPSSVRDVITKSNGLRLYLNNLQVGRSATPRSWLYEGKSDTEVLSKWMAVLETVRSKSPHGELVYQFDTSQLKKWGPQGAVEPIKELMEIVTEGFQYAESPQPAVFRSEMWQRAKAEAIKDLIVDQNLYKRLRPRAREHVVDDMANRDTLDSNSGYPDFSRRKKPEVLQSAFAAIESGEYKEFPAIALFRNYNQKTRLVWMYPMATNIVEGSFTQPLKEALQHSSLKFFAPWRGYEYVKQNITADYEQGYYLSASDFSHTDAHFTKWAMLEVYDVIKYAFQEQFWPELKESMLHVCEIPLLISANEWIRGGHGVSSGSNWTNDCETYLDYIAEKFLALKRLVDKPADAIGDDVRHKRKSYLKELNKLIAEEYNSMNFDVNAEKVTNEETWLKYLQRLTIKGYYSEYGTNVSAQYPTGTKLLRGIYSTIRALNSSLNPEKFHSPKLWNSDMFCIRQFMILENCVDHPLFKEFVQFVCKGNEHLIPFAKKTDNYLNEKFQESRHLPGLNPTYNQEKRDKPLSEFESIKLARTL